MILNCDLVVASQQAQFALPEVKRGVIAIQGGMVACKLADTLLILAWSNTKTCKNSWSSGLFAWLLKSNYGRDRLPSAQLASEMLLLGRTVSADEAHSRFGLWVQVLTIYNFHHHFLTCIQCKLGGTTVPSAINCNRGGKGNHSKFTRCSTGTIDVFYRTLSLDFIVPAQSTKQALVLSQSRGHEDTVQTHVWSHETKTVFNGKNIKVGVVSWC